MHNENPVDERLGTHFAFSIAWTVCWAISRSSSVRTTRNPYPSTIFLYFGDIPLGYIILRCVNGDSQVFQTLARPLPDQGCVLTYTSGENNGVYAAEHRGIRSYVFLDAVAEHIDRQLCTIVSFPA